MFQRKTVYHNHLTSLTSNGMALSALSLEDLGTFRDVTHSLTYVDF